MQRGEPARPRHLRGAHGVLVRGHPRVRRARLPGDPASAEQPTAAAGGGALAFDAQGNVFSDSVTADFGLGPAPEAHIGNAFLLALDP